MADPLIIFVPGLRPKPEPDKHAEAMMRCLRTGISHVDDALANELQTKTDWFDLVDWNFAFYQEYHDIETDAAGIAAVLLQQAASETDRQEAMSWKLRFAKQVYRFADRFQFLIPRLADKKTQIHLRDLKRYVRNIDNIADRTRQALIGPLLRAAAQGRPTLLIGHSMGSLISYDSLWLLSHASSEGFELDTFMTLGSPLGQRYVQHRLLGYRGEGAARYPTNIRHWLNIAAVGDLTALDVDLQDDYADMLKLGLVDNIDDHSAYNFFRDGGDGGPLNMHAEYGYLVNEVVAGAIARWWRQVQQA